MNNEQNPQNPDVNSYDPEVDSAELIEHDRRDEDADIEGTRDDEPIPVPPDAEQPHPVEEQPSGDDRPIGDVNDSPKRIVS